MPIRFRCAYCSQLMGIARRKAGSVVKCPKCAGEIIVPVPEGSAEGHDVTEEPAGDGVFEDANFDPRGQGTVGADATAATDGPSSPQPILTTPPKRLGVFLSIGSLVISVIVVILLLILMFVLGLIIGGQKGVETKSVLSSPLVPAHMGSALTDS